MEKFEGELAVKWAGLQALRLNVADPSTLMQLKGVLNPVLLLLLVCVCVCVCMRACVCTCVLLVVCELIMPPKSLYQRHVHDKTKH